MFSEITEKQMKYVKQLSDIRHQIAQAAEPHNNALMKRGETNEKNPTDEPLG